MSRRVRLWAGIGALLGGSFGALPVGVAELMANLQSLPVSTWTLLALWPASAIACAGIGAGAAYLVDWSKESKDRPRER